MYEETQMEKTFRKLKRLEEMLHDRMFVPVDQVKMSVWTTKSRCMRSRTGRCLARAKRTQMAGGRVVLLVSGRLYRTGKAGRTDAFYFSEDQRLRGNALG